MDASELLVTPLAYMPPVQALDGLSREQAGVRVSSSSHSVVEILAHMVYWQSWFLERCAGVATPPAEKASLGWPAVSSDDWESVRRRFLEDLERALKAGEDESALVRRIDPRIEFPPLANYTVSDAITHIAVHNAHHLGQIITLRQIMGAWPPPGGSHTW